MDDQNLSKRLQAAVGIGMDGGPKLPKSCFVFFCARGGTLDDVQ